MDHATRGAAALEAKDFPTALSAYTQALIGHPTSPDYYTQRSAAFARLTPPRYDLAIKDAEYGVLFAQKRAKREKIQAAQHRRVVALHGAGRYADAKFLLTTMEKWRPKDSKPAKMEGDMWMARLDGKLKNLSAAEKIPTAKEFPEVQLPEGVTLKEQLKAQLNPDGSYRLDQDTSDKPSQAPSSTSDKALPPRPANGNAHPETTTPTGTGPAPKIRHEWYQNTQSVILTLYAKGVSKSDAEIDIQEDSVSVSFPRPSDPSSSFTFTLDPLFALVDPSESKFAIMPTKVELTLKKAQAGQKWHNIEGTTPLKAQSEPNDRTAEDNVVKSAVMSTIVSAQASTVPPKATAPAYPTSSRSGPKDWDKVANDLHTKARAEGKAKAKNSTTKSDSDEGENEVDDIDSDVETGDAVDGFFKKLYKGADDDTRRAMMKSFVESNGTSLSTNWSEVGKGKVEEVKSKNDD